MENEKSYALKTTLSVEGATTETVNGYAAVLESALVKVLPKYPAVNAYFVVVDSDALEIDLGLRFEGMKPKYIKDVANEILGEAIEAVNANVGEGHGAVREESTLVPA